MTSDPRWSAETESGLTQMLAEEFVVATTGSRDPNRLAARAVLDWMAHRGLLVEAGGETWYEADCPDADCRRHARSQHTHRRTRIEWPNGAWYAGPWEPQP